MGLLRAKMPDGSHRDFPIEGDTATPEELTAIRLEIFPGMKDLIGGAIEQGMEIARKIPDAPHPLEWEDPAAIERIRGETAATKGMAAGGMRPSPQLVEEAWEMARSGRPMFEGQREDVDAPGRLVTTTEVEAARRMQGVVEKARSPEFEKYSGVRGDFPEERTAWSHSGTPLPESTVPVYEPGPAIGMKASKAKRAQAQAEQMTMASMLGSAAAGGMAWLAAQPFELLGKTAMQALGTSAQRAGMQAHVPDEGLMQAVDQAEARLEEDISSRKGRGFLEDRKAELAKDVAYFAEGLEGLASTIDKALAESSRTPTEERSTLPGTLKVLKRAADKGFSGGQTTSEAMLTDLMLMATSPVDYTNRHPIMVGTMAGPALLSLAKYGVIRLSVPAVRAIAKHTDKMLAKGSAEAMETFRAADEVAESLSKVVAPTKIEGVSVPKVSHLVESPTDTMLREVFDLATSEAFFTNRLMATEDPLFAATTTLTKKELERSLAARGITPPKKATKKELIAMVQSADVPEANKGWIHRQIDKTSKDFMRAVDEAAGDVQQYLTAQLPPKGASAADLRAAAKRMGIKAPRKGKAEAVRAAIMAELPALEKSLRSTAMSLKAEDLARIFDVSVEEAAANMAAYRGRALGRLARGKADDMIVIREGMPEGAMQGQAPPAKPLVAITAVEESKVPGLEIQAGEMEIPKAAPRGPRKAPPAEPKEAKPRTPEEAAEDIVAIEAEAMQSGEARVPLSPPATYGRMADANDASVAMAMDMGAEFVGRPNMMRNVEAARRAFGFAAVGKSVETVAEWLREARSLGFHEGSKAIETAQDILDVAGRRGGLVRPMNAVEMAGMHIRMQDLTRAIAWTRRQIADLIEAPGPKAADPFITLPDGTKVTQSKLQSNFRHLESEYDYVSTAYLKGQSEWGRTGVAAQFAVPDRFSPRAMRDTLIANKEAPLTKAEEALVANLSRKMEPLVEQRNAASDRVNNLYSQLESARDSDMQPSALKVIKDEYKDSSRALFDLDEQLADLEWAWSAEKLRTMPIQKKVLHWLYEVFNAPRTMMASLDFSALGRQMGGVLFGEFVPVSIDKGFMPISREALSVTLRSAKHKKVFDQMQREFVSGKMGEARLRSGLAITDVVRPGDDIVKSPWKSVDMTEELFRSKIAEMMARAQFTSIPGVPGSGVAAKALTKTLNTYGRLIQASERAYVGALNSARVTMFDSIVGLNAAGESAVGYTLQEMRFIADMINKLTGRGTLAGLEHTPAGAAALNIANAALFAPRYNLSKWQALLKPIDADLGILIDRVIQHVPEPKRPAGGGSVLPTDAPSMADVSPFNRIAPKETPGEWALKRAGGADKLRKHPRWIALRDAVIRPIAGRLMMMGMADIASTAVGEQNVSVTWPWEVEKGTAAGRISYRPFTDMEMSVDLWGGSDSLPRAFVNSLMHGRYTRAGTYREYGGRNESAWSSMARAARMSANPSVGFLLDVMLNEDFMGDPYDSRMQAALISGGALMAPITIGQAATRLIHGVSSEGVGGGEAATWALTSSLLEGLGMNVSTPYARHALQKKMGRDVQARRRLKHFRPQRVGPGVLGLPPRAREKGR